MYKTVKMEINSKFESSSIEKKWYKKWISNNCFSSKPNKKTPYTIVIPPPNVTGVLHMGHMLNNCIQDILIRRARMLGFNACWVPGTDHASIATEAKVVAYLKNKGIEKSDLSRDEFLKYAWEWTENYGGKILNQLKKIGCSCDWDRNKFTLDNDMNESVISVFIDLYKKGLIYKGNRMVNWDPLAQTTLSDEEVIYREKKSSLYYFIYKLKNSSESLTVASTRPETIFGDTAICVNPNDRRYKNFIGKKVIVPITNKEISVISDEYVDMELGSGCLKITPSHDVNDKILGEKHSLEFINIFNLDGTLNSNGLHYEGLDRFDVRNKVIDELKSLKLFLKEESYKSNIAFSERTNAVIEPRLSDQWFLSMKKISKPALKAVFESNEIKIFPKKFINTYKKWLENIKDWNISRQLWWGQRIPVYYINGDRKNFVVAKNKEDALKLAIKKTDKQIKEINLVQESDVLDTWFSSWLWPISVFDGIRVPNNKEINYYYPTSDLVTGPDILFFWVIRMIISGYEYRKSPPFKNIYLTGIVRDKVGKKMSKQLGNSPDPIDLIEEYGADAVRVGIMLSSPAGNDLLFDKSLCQQGKNFANKIWNSYRLINSLKTIEKTNIDNIINKAMDWYEDNFNYNLNLINEDFKNYKISDALMKIYKLIWDDFCSNLLEIIKPEIGNYISIENKLRLIKIFKKNLKILHPFMPFLTEELWDYINDSDDLIMNSSWPNSVKYSNNNLIKFSNSFKLVSEIRRLRKNEKIKFKEKISLYYNAPNLNKFSKDIIEKLGYVAIEKKTDSKQTKNSVNFIVNKIDFFVILNQKKDFKSEIKSLEKELDYYKNFHSKIIKKLSNKSFASKAPKKVIEIEKKREIDISDKIKILELNLKKLSK